MKIHFRKLKNKIYDILDRLVLGKEYIELINGNARKDALFWDEYYKEEQNEILEQAKQLLEG